MKPEQKQRLTDLAYDSGYARGEVDEPYDQRIDLFAPGTFRHEAFMRGYRDAQTYQRMESLGNI